MRLTYGQLMLGVAALCATASGCGGGSKCCTPVDAATGKDAATGRDARLDQSVTDVGRTDVSTADAKDAATGKDAAAGHDARLDQSATDAGRTDASTTDAKDGPAGLPCPSANFDVSADVCANDVGIGIRSILVTGTCGDYRVVENVTNGDNHVYYYFDASGALVAIVHSSGPGYFCSAGLVAVIPRPCYLNGTRLYCGTDGGTSDRPQL